MGNKEKAGKLGKLNSAYPTSNCSGSLIKWDDTSVKSLVDEQRKPMELNQCQDNQHYERNAVNFPRNTKIIPGNVKVEKFKKTKNQQHDGIYNEQLHV